MNSISKLISGLRMENTRKFVKVFGNLGLLLLTISCQPLSSQSPAAEAPNINLDLTEDVENESQEHLYVLAKYGGVYTGVQAERVVARIMGRLVSASSNPSIKYRITVLNSPEVNAFALPGGYLYITRGLVALANDSSELAAVLAHEMGHITSRHGLARLKRAEEVELLNRVVSNVVNDPDESQKFKRKSLISLASFSREQELSADRIGVRTAARAGFDPFATARFLEYRERYSTYFSTGGQSDGQDDYLASHPSTPERVQLAQRLARQYGAPGIGERDRSGFLQNIDGILYGDDPLRGFVRGNRFFHKKLEISFLIPQDYIVENLPESVLVSHSEGHAIRFDSTDLGRDETLRNYFDSGWINGLIPQSIRQKTINGLPAMSASAKVDNRYFIITVIRVGERGYRFISATPDLTYEFLQDFKETTESFRQLNFIELSSLSPLQIRVIQSQEGDTPAKLARYMSGVRVSQRLSLFTVLNGIHEYSFIRPNSLFKVIVE